MLLLASSTPAERHTRDTRTQIHREHRDERNSKQPDREEREARAVALRCASLTRHGQESNPVGLHSPCQFNEAASARERAPVRWRFVAALVSLSRSEARIIALVSIDEGAS